MTRRIAVLPACALLLMGCGGQMRTADDRAITRGSAASARRWNAASAPARAPAWVEQGSAVLAPPAGGRVFRGVGVTQGGMADGAEQRAQERSKSELAKLLNSWLAVISSRNVGHGGELAARRSDPDHPHPRESSRNAALSSLPSLVVRGRWQDPADGAFFILSELDLEAVKKSISAFSDMDPATRRDLLERADKAFDELAEERP